GAGGDAESPAHRLLARSAHALRPIAGGVTPGPSGTSTGRRAAVDGTRGSRLDERQTGPASARAARLGLPPAAQAQPAAAPAPPRPSRSGRARRLQKNFRPLLREVATAFPDAQVEVWAVDEHRIGLKPLLRRVWAPIGHRPVAVVRHRFEWRYLVGFVHPASGRTV